MEEDETTKEETTETTTTENAKEIKSEGSDSNKPQATDLVAKANEAAERLEKANARQEELLKRQEAIQVEKTLGGTTDAGEANKEETPAEYAKKVMENGLEKEN